jgi:acid phosphatase
MTTRVGLALSALLLLTPIRRAHAEVDPASAPIDHLLVIYLENHTFDNLFGLFPGANGVTSRGASVRQVDKTGKAYASLPQVTIGYPYPPRPDPRFPKKPPNAPFRIDRYVPIDQIVEMPVHRYYPNILQIAGGTNDRFVSWGDSGALPMGYFDTTKLPLYPYARRYVLADNWFTSAFGGSWLNHLWLVCACTGTFPHAPGKLVADPVVDGSGRVVDLRRDGSVSPDGFAVDHLEPFNPPYQAGTPDDERVPPQTMPTIGDRLSDAGISWAWYSEGWDDAVAGHPAASFTFHQQPFVYFARYAPGTKDRAEHLKDAKDLRKALRDGTLPSVAWFKPLNVYTDNAGEGSMIVAENRVIKLIEAVKASPVWPRTAIVITWDDYGGFFDHVPPPVIDRWGPSNRVPTIIISPWAKRSYIDSTQYETVSLLKFIEWRWGVAPLAPRDTRANNILAAFDFTARRRGEPVHHAP